MSDWRPGANLDILRERARLNADIRAFFALRGVLEVETPLLCSSAATDLHLAAFAIEGKGLLRPLFLQTSPEFAMKRLLAAGSGPIYQLGKAFRAGDISARHNPEFTILEWYRPGFTLPALMDEMEALLLATAGSAAAEQITPGVATSFARCERTTYRALFETRFGINPHTADAAMLRTLVLRETTFGDAAALDAVACLDLLFAMLIEPSLGHVQPVFVFDFPALQASLARVIVNDDGDRVAARCEVYMRGMELANGYLELTDAIEQRRRFVADNAARAARGLPEIPLDERLLAALAAGLPECSGIALGVDRLLMLRTGAASIDAVLAFAAPQA